MKALDLGQAPALPRRKARPDVDALTGENQEGRHGVLAHVEREILGRGRRRQPQSGAEDKAAFFPVEKQTVGLVRNQNRR